MSGSEREWVCGSTASRRIQPVARARRIASSLVLVIAFLLDTQTLARSLRLTIGPLHGYGIARRIEQTSANLLSVNYGTLYPALVKLEQEGCIAFEWGLSENNRKAKYYRLTRAGRKQLKKAAEDWEQATAILARFLAPGEEPSR